MSRFLQAIGFAARYQPWWFWGGLVLEALCTVAVCFGIWLLKVVMQNIHHWDPYCDKVGPYAVAWSLGMVTVLCVAFIATTTLGRTIYDEM